MSKDTSALCGGIEPYDERPLRAVVQQCGFGFYSDEQIKGLSVLEITSAQTFDEMGHAIPGGLNDARLGAMERDDICPTCGLGDLACPGHHAHIALPVPVYHPLLFDRLFMLLRSQCGFCKSLRLSKHRKRVALLKLRLYDLGQWKAVSQLEQRLASLKVRQCLTHLPPMATKQDP